MGYPALVRHARRVALPAICAAALGCTDTNVPFLTAPTAIARTPTGLQNAVTGLFFAARIDVGSSILAMSAFARDAGDFTNTEPRWVTQGLGLVPILPQDQLFSLWDQEFSNAKLANTILASIAQVRPAYTPAQVAELTGVVQTMKALQFMMIAESHDSTGVPVASITSTSPAPILCNADVWRYIVALLDSANVALGAAGATPMPVILPSGFAAVGGFGGPSTSPGSFAAFNRALAGKAGLELAYAIARGAGAGPTPTTAGAPDRPALLRADSALQASALFDPAAITPPSLGTFALNDPFAVYHVWSGQSGDIRNPVSEFLGTFPVMWDFVVDVDTTDARWRAKFALNPNPVQEKAFAAVASPFVFAYYASPSAPVPIVRNEELTLVDAQIQLGLAQYAAAAALINTVHQQAGGFSTPLTIPADYIHVRDALLREQRISTAFEASTDRTIAIRMYGMASVADTTWVARGPGPDSTGIANAEAALGGPVTDLHTTTLPVPQSEIDGRHGNGVVSCP